MAIVPLDHPCVGVTEVLCNDQQRSAAHDGQAGPGVPHRMEAGRRLHPRPRAGLLHWPVLVRLQPAAAGSFKSKRSWEAPPGAQRPEEFDTLLAEYDVAAFAALADANMERAAVRVEISGHEVGQLSVATACQERGL